MPDYVRQDKDIIQTLQRDIKSVSEKHEKLQTRTLVEAWNPILPVAGGVEPYFYNSWVNYGAPFYDAAFMKDPLGFVHLRGLIKSGATTATMFILPIGYRPAKQHIFTSLAADVVCRIDVYPTGIVFHVSGGTNAYLSLDPITFQAYAGV